MKKVLSMILALIMTASMLMALPTLAVAPDGIYTIETNGYIIDSGEDPQKGELRQNVNNKWGVNQGAFAIFEIKLPAGLEVNQSIESCVLTFASSTPTQIYACKAGSAAAGWTDYETNVATVQSEEKQIDAENITKTPHGVDEDSSIIAIDLTEYANELVYSEGYSFDTGITMYVALQNAKYTKNIKSGTIKGFTYEPPTTTINVKTKDNVEADAVKLIDYEPSTEVTTTATPTIYGHHSSEDAKTITGGSFKISLGNNYKSLVVFKIALPDSLLDNQTIENCSIEFVTTAATYETSWPIYVSKLGSTALDMTYDQKDAAICNEANHLAFEQAATTDYDDATRYITVADLTEYANELAAAGQTTMYIGLGQDYFSGGERGNGSASHSLRLGNTKSTGGKSMPVVTTTVKTSPVIDYEAEASLESLDAESSYVAITKATNLLDTNASVYLLVAQYKGDELLSLSSFEAMTVEGNSEDLLLKTEPVSIDANADKVKAFMWSDNGFKPLSLNATASVVSAQ